jgi:predicted dinucleotide-binding enzyme
VSGGFRVVVLGGYGNFGALIAVALAKIDGIAVIVAGRDARRAEDMRRASAPRARGSTRATRRSPLASPSFPRSS